MDEPTLTAHIRAGAAAHDGCPLVFVTGDGERTTTLGRLVSDAEKTAGALQARGIGRGDVVAVQLPGSYEGAVIQAAVGRAAEPAADPDAGHAHGDHAGVGCRPGR